jgi:predicted peptidase
LKGSERGERGGRFLREETKLFAAGVPIAGYGNNVGKLRSMPIWSFHGAKDNVVKVDVLGTARKR